MRTILARAASSEGYLEVLANANLQPYGLAGDEISAMTRNEIDMWGKVVRAAKAQAR